MSTVEAVARMIGAAVRPLLAITAGEPEDIFELGVQLGWVLPAPPPPAFTALAGTAAAVAESVAAIEDAKIDLDEGTGTESDIVEATARLVLDLAALASEIAGLPAALRSQLPADYVAATQIDRDVQRRLYGWLLASAISDRAPRTYAALCLAGLIDDVAEPEQTERHQPAYQRRELRWDRVPQLVTEPEAVLRDVYRWGTPAIDIERLHDALLRLGIAIIAPPSLEPTSDELLAIVAPGVPVPPDGAEPGIVFPFLDLGAVTVSLVVTPLPSNGAPQPLAFSLRATGLAALTIPLFHGASIELAAGVDLGSGFGVVIRPGGPPSAFASLDQGVRLETGKAAARFVYDLEEPLDLLVIAGCGVQADAVFLGCGVEAIAGGVDPFVEVGLRGGHLGISPTAVDSFIASLLPSSGAGVDFDLLLRWSQARGVQFDGGGGLELSIPLQLSLGPLRIETVHARAEAANAMLAAELSVSASGALGPVKASIDRIGVAFDVALSPGNLGPIGLDVRFKPPSGVALSIEAGPVTGGGSLFFDVAKQQYAGSLHLKFEQITLDAIGLLTTRLPDGSPGFSLLVIVQASGFTPIQLGFGFTLNGVGGLLGIHRTVAVDVLREGVRNRTLDAILFSPDDPTPRAPQIISTLQTVFPPAVNQHVFGPMALIGWGAPVTLITIEIALILELPSPLRLIILGRVRAALPDAKHPIVGINCDVIGIIDFDRRELSVDASLYDSVVGPFALSGDMAARASWGAHPDFAMALGGFHPAFKPPPGFPALRRLAIALSTGDNPRLRMEAYFALTSNTVQVGAQLELYVRIAGFSLEGGLGFDTLIQFSPFRLLADIHAYLALKRGGTTLMGLDIDVHLSGPAPWVLWGRAKFKIFFLSFSIPFRATFGRAEDVPAIERQDVWPILRDNLTATGNWSAQLPPESGCLVVIRADAGAGDDGPLAHPLGTLIVSQSLVPLERTLGLFGSVPPKDYDRFAITGAAGLDLVGPTTQHFAPAQFRQMSDAEKLASPSFERMVSGARFAPHAATALGHVQDTPLDYEQSVILDVDQPASERLEERYTPGGTTIAALAEHGPAGTAELRTQGRAKFAPPAPGPVVAEPAFVVVHKDDLVPVALDGHDGSYTSAAERLRHRADRHVLQIVRAEELELT